MSDTAAAKTAHFTSASSWISATWGTAAFIAIACVALIGLEASHIISQRADVLADGKKDTANIASSLIQHAELTFRTADALLIGVVERLEHGALEPEEHQRLKAWFIEEVHHSSQFISFAVIDSAGAMLINSLGQEASATFSDREYFVYHQAHADRGLRINSPIQGRKAGEWLIPATRRFNRADGSFGGIAVAAVSPKYFQDFYDKFELGKNGAVLLASMNAKLLVRRPFLEANVGRDMSQSGVFKQLKQSPVGSLEITASTDGVRRMNSYEQGQFYPLVIAVAQDVDELLAPWRQSALRRLGETGGIILLISGLGVLVWRTTDRLAAKARKLREANVRFDVAMNTMAQGLCLYDSGQRVIMANRQYADIYRLTVEQIRPGTSLADILKYRREKGAGFCAPDSDFVGVKAANSSEIQELADGRVISIVRHAMEDGGWLAIHDDVTDRTKNERRISYLATHDQLTGLPNRHQLATLLEEITRKTRRSNDKISVFMLDLDGFKRVNDTLGHSAGDRLLESVARRIKGCVRDADMVARLGGDEFAIIQLLNDDEREAATAMALRIIETIAEPFDIAGETVNIGISIGIALAPEHGRVPLDLMQKADVALYAAKAAGKNGFRLHDAGVPALSDGLRATEGSRSITESAA